MLDRAETLAAALRSTLSQPDAVQGFVTVLLLTLRGNERLAQNETAVLQFDARTSVVLRRLAFLLRLRLSAVAALEEMALRQLQRDRRSWLEQQQHPEEEDSQDDHTSEMISKWMRHAQIGAAAATAGGLLFVTGGMAAPALAAGLSGLGLVSAATYATSTMTATLLGTAGAGLAAYKVHRRTEGLTHFEFQPINTEKEAEEEEMKGMTVYICISGHLRQAGPSTAIVDPKADDDSTPAAAAASSTASTSPDFHGPWGSQPPHLFPVQALHRFYSLVAPDKRVLAPALLQHYAGREDELFGKLKDIYNVDPANLQSDRCQPSAFLTGPKAATYHQLINEGMAHVRQLIGEPSTTETTNSNVLRAQSSDLPESALNQHIIDPEKPWDDTLHAHQERMRLAEGEANQLRAEMEQQMKCSAINVMEVSEDEANQGIIVEMEQKLDETDHTSLESVESCSSSTEGQTSAVQPAETESSLSPQRFWSAAQNLLLDMEKKLEDMVSEVEEEEVGSQTSAGELASFGSVESSSSFEQQYVDKLQAEIDLLSIEDTVITTDSVTVGKGSTTRSLLKKKALTTQQETVYSWRENIANFGDQYTLIWDPEKLLSIGHCVENMIKEGAEEGIQKALQYTAFSAILSAVATPLAIVSVINSLDESWTVASAAADEAGLLLADALLSDAHGNRPVVLVGYSLGGRVVAKCLTELAAIAHGSSEESSTTTKGDRGSYGVDDYWFLTESIENDDIICKEERQRRLRAATVVRDAVIIGAPIDTAADKWALRRSVVLGRLVNVYCPSDWVLSTLYRFKSWSVIPLAGLKEVKLPLNSEEGEGESGFVGGVENFDVADIVAHNGEYPLKILSILQRVAVGDVDCEHYHCRYFPTAPSENAIHT